MFKGKLDVKYGDVVVSRSQTPSLSRSFDNSRPQSKVWLGANISASANLLTSSLGTPEALERSFNDSHISSFGSSESCATYRRLSVSISDSLYLLTP